MKSHTSAVIDHLVKLRIKSLQSLNLSDNKFNNECCDKLAKLGPSLSHLEFLRMHNNSITPGGHINLLELVGKLSNFKLTLSSPSEEECQLLMSLTNNIIFIKLYNYI